MSEVNYGDKMSPGTTFEHDNPISSFGDHPNKSFGKDNSSALKINIGKKAMDKTQRENLLHLIKKCLGLSSLQIVIKDYSKDIRMKINDDRKFAELSDNIEIETDNYYEESEEDEPESEMLPFDKMPRISQHMQKILRKTVDSANVSKLIAFKACTRLYSEIRKAAYSKNIRIDLNPRGYSISGNDEKEMDGFANRLREYDRNTAFVELYKGKPVDTIRALYPVLLNVKELLMAKYQLDNLYLISHDKYSQAYNCIMGKSSLDDEKRKPEISLRFVLCKEGIQERKDISQEVNLTVSKSIHLFQKLIEVPGRELISRKEIECVTKLVRKAGFMLDYKDYQDKFNKEHPKIVLFAYYYSDKNKYAKLESDKLEESTEDRIKLKCQKLEEKISKILPIKSEGQRAFLAHNDTEIQHSEQAIKTESFILEVPSQKEDIVIYFASHHSQVVMSKLFQLKEVTEGFESFAKEKKINLTKPSGGDTFYYISSENLKEAYHVLDEYFSRFTIIQLQSQHPEKKINKKTVLKMFKPLKNAFDFQNIFFFTTKVCLQIDQESAETSLRKICSLQSNPSLIVTLIQSNSLQKSEESLKTTLSHIFSKENLKEEGFLCEIEIPHLQVIEKEKKK